MAKKSKVTEMPEIRISVKFFTRQDVWITADLFDQYRKGQIEVGSRISFREHPNGRLQTGIVEGNSPILFLSKL